MIQRPTVLLLTIAGMVLGASIVCLAQPESLLTSHVPEVVLNKQAPFVGRIPSTQPMRIDIVLPVRDRQAWILSCERSTILPAPPTGTSSRWSSLPRGSVPARRIMTLVVRFATANGFTVTGGSRDAMDVQLKGSVATIETAFHVNMGLYRDPSENRDFYTPDREPTVDLPFHLWHISGLDNYSIPRR